MVGVEGKATSCKWAAWKMYTLVDSEHSRMSPEAVSSKVAVKDLWDTPNVKMSCFSLPCFTWLAFPSYCKV